MQLPVWILHTIYILIAICVIAGLSILESIGETIPIRNDLLIGDMLIKRIVDE